MSSATSARPNLTPLTYKQLFLTNAGKTSQPSGSNQSDDRVRNGMLDRSVCIA
ncbi:MAG: hypothetical protein H7X80_02160 [bacterium]|nr:hypothetical protein [Candidatus Kapabacteria bacterium]